ncbi:TPA: M12 family metallopeptidase [Elizabethkingia anophelis]
MKKKVLIMIGFAALSLGACKPELEVNENKSTLESTKANGTIVHKFVINGNDTYVNETNGRYYYADDVIISPDQFNYLKNLSASGATVERSTISKSFAKTWPSGIMYYRMPDRSVLNRFNQRILISLDENQLTQFRENIDRAMNMISAQTGIQFVERTNQAEYLYFQANSEANNSPIGWRAFANQGELFNRVNVANMTMPAIIAHEIMHSMGIMHEQCRPDRDQFVNINLDNVAEIYRHNFNIDTKMAAHGDFDFGSVMMYGPGDFAIDRNIAVITRVDGRPYVSQRVNLSAGDYAGINQLYSPANTAGVNTFNIASALDNSLNIQSRSVPNNVISVRLDLQRGTAGNNQRFVLHKASEQGYYIIRSAEDATKALTISGTADGSSVELRRNTNASTQKWLLENLGNKGYTLAPMNAPNLRLEARVLEGLTASGTTIIIGNRSIVNATTGEVADSQCFNLVQVN